MRPPPTRITALNGPWPLHDAAASRQAEQQALLAAAPHALMEAAGLAVARLGLALAPHARRVAVWAGPGNNGGDGWVAARHLHERGLQVQVLHMAASAHGPADAEQARQQALRAGVPAQAWTAGPAPAADLHIDALLGLGVRQAPSAAAAAAIQALNQAAGRGAVVLAVDLPSGLHPDTGALLGAEAVRASATLALLTLKPGCHTAQGRDHAGDLWFDNLGVAAGPPTALLLGPPVGQPRLHSSHKGSHGDVVVVGGAPGMVGAAWLAARAALEAGAGRVYVSALDPEAALLDPMQPALMARQQWWTLPPEVLATATVVVGCGGGSAVAATLPALLRHVPRLVLDADALNALAADASLLARLRERAAHGHATLLTPHPLEAARLLGQSTAEMQADRLAAAWALATRCQATVLLKGSGSVLATPGTLPCINPTGNAALATAGTGDVLAGWVAGLWAQRPSADPEAVAQQAVWQHGRAADLHARHAAPGAPLTAGALISALAARPPEG
ncbi:carbohydrate kinase [beta proteobacterium AAP51]|nr:carbohydrate kinase [beta proteobacterium AAP51]